MRIMRITLAGAVDWEAFTSSTSVADPATARSPNGSRTAGAELYARVRFEPVHLTATYAYLDATELEVGRGVRLQVPLNPRHAGGLSAVYEKSKM